MQEIFGATDMMFLIALMWSVIAGLALGVERELRGKDAGISTHILVVTGAMIFTYLSAAVDPASTSRIAAGIVTGVGFLGAGLILKDGGSVHNLTTAASVWFASAIGMAFGFGFYTVGIAATIIGVLIPRIPRIPVQRKD